MGTSNYYELSSAICGVWGGGSALRGPEGIVMWQLLLFRATNSNLLRSAKFSVVSQRLCVCAGVCGCAGCVRLLGSTLLEDGMVLSDCQKYICLGYATEISLKHVMTISAARDSDPFSQSSPSSLPPCAGLGQQLPAGALGFERLLLLPS